MTEHTKGVLLTTLQSIAHEVETARTWSEASRALADERVATVFGSARATRGEPAYAMAQELGAALAARRWTTVTGGGPGIMQAARDGSGETLSRAVRVKIAGEEPETVLDPARSITVATFALRKLLLTHDIDALFVFPGGVGTLDELYEVLVHHDTDRLDRFPVVLMQPPGVTLWTAWLDFMEEQLVSTGLVSPSVLKELVVAESVAEALAAVEEREPPAGDWRTYDRGGALPDAERRSA
ncbi:LOG family protein [Streptomyces sp. LP05-1]|uniref:LOG family protein n=1 Tax=Streptomyces pyxinae TaxID=2970734 RepID=A0ABT2CHQ0_9ACTN|nr:LOG family protein [Streptomyces sp. LP05-1]MCS0636939.1 LOG family protein [Streptomyces sp. LP05-1]